MLLLSILEDLRDEILETIYMLMLASLAAMLGVANYHTNSNDPRYNMQGLLYDDFIARMLIHALIDKEEKVKAFSHPAMLHEFLGDLEQMMRVLDKAGQCVNEIQRRTCSTQILVTYRLL